MKNKKDEPNPSFAKILTPAGLFICILSACVWFYVSSSQTDTKQSLVIQASEDSTLEKNNSFNLNKTPETIQVRALADQTFESFNKQEGTPRDLGPLPTSLLGSSHGSKLNMTDDGNLLINKDVRDFFEFYLAAIDEEGLDKILLRINRDLTIQLSGDALQQANELLRNYIDYKISLAELEDSIAGSTTSMDITELKRRHDMINSLREEFMGKEVAEIFFGQDEIYDNYMLSRIAVTQNKELTADEKKQALAEVELLLPEEKRVKRARSTQHLRLSSAVSDLRKNGASESEIYQLRLDAVGADAAGKLAELDDKRALWRQRLDGYVTERDQIKSSGLSHQEQTVAINDLIEQRFQGREQIRVRALDPELKAQTL
mgnify:CR=1 FL=1